MVPAAGLWLYFHSFKLPGKVHFYIAIKKLKQFLTAKVQADFKQLIRYYK